MIPSIFKGFAFKDRSILLSGQSRKLSETSQETVVFTRYIVVHLMALQSELHDGIKGPSGLQVIRIHHLMPKHNITNDISD